jgi:hypothetical protein
MTVEGELVRDRGIAGELLLRRAARMRGSQAERLVGTLAGFQVFVADTFMQGPQILLKGATTHPAKVTDTALGTIRSVEHAIQNLEDLAESLTRAITDTRKRLADTQAQVGAPFEYAGRLAELLRRQDEIESALDLAKSQVPSQFETEPSDQAMAITPTEADTGGVTVPGQCPPVTV